MEQIVGTTETGAVGKGLFRTGARAVDAGNGKNATGRSERKSERTGTSHALVNQHPSWGSFCTKARFFGLQDQDLKLLMQVGRVTHTRDGQQLFCEGECNDVIFIILDGKVKLGKTAHKPHWIDMGPYGMINMDEDEEPVWSGYHVCSASHSLGGLPLTLETCHSLTAVSDGECDLLVLETSSLEKHLALQGRSHQATRIMTSLRQMLC
ncbi:MAG: cyclic nucleotide-binding domain-containing protein [Magnetococcales bacterium]|nr:cyclic nucleotide-binding domain-containing protein [Magnetococcales bacterium]